MTATGGAPRYRLESRIATGGMGEVWRATDTVLDREVALKLLKAEYADDPTFRSRFQTEARNAAALHHPNVASVFDFGELPAGEGAGDTPRPYLVMELVRGQPLSALLRGGEPMPAATATDLVTQAADGLAAAHALGIVHRDVKPANLLVTPDRTVKITDFGIARAADSVALTQTGQVLGTPQYLSPEQAEGKQATPASDIYSLGVVLYECLAGRRPFDGDTPISTALAHIREQPPPLPDDVPSGLRDAVAVALAKDPEARFRTVGDFAMALRGGPVLAGAPAAVPGSDDPTLVAAPAAVPAPDGTRVTSTTTGLPPEHERRRGGLPGWLPWAAAALAVLLLVFVVAQLSGRDPGGSTAAGQSPSQGSASAQPTQAAEQPRTQASTTPSTEPSSEPSSEPTDEPSTPSATPSDDRIQVNADDYVGRPKDDVENDLEDLGFEVDDETVDNPGDAEKDTVADVSPTGLVEPGRTITLSVYDDPVEVPATPGEDENNGNGNSGSGGGGGNGQGKGSGRR